MALTPEQLEDLNDLLTGIDGEKDKMSQWEASFIQDQVDRLEKYGQSMFLSPKQWAVIRRIHVSLCGTAKNEDDYE